MNRDQLTQYLVTNCDCWKGKEEVLKGFTEEELKKLAQNLAVLKVVNSSGIPEDKFNPEGLVTILTNGLKEVVTNSDEAETDDTNDDDAEVQRLTMDQWEAFAPLEVLESFQAAREIAQNQKTELISKLTANVAEAKKETVTNSLKTKTIAQLNEMALLLPVPTTNTKPQPKLLKFGPAAGVTDFGPAGITGGGSNQPQRKTQASEAPVINWAEAAKELSK